MSAKKTDISQIRKYLNGELDARAMHKLEREAQDDPFLMDALEGYTAQGKDQQANLDELQQRFNDRINKDTKKRIVLWPVIATAASVLIFMGVGLWFYLNHPSTPSAIIPVTDKVTIIKPAAPVTNKQSVIDTQLVIAQTELKQTNNKLSIVHHRVKKHAIPNSVATVEAAPVIAMAPKDKTTDSLAKGTVLNEVVITGYQAQRRKDITGSVASVGVVTIDQSLQGRAAGVSVNKDSKRRKDTSRTITGRIISADDKQPVVGAAVTVLGKNRGTVTDVNGRFKIQVEKDDNVKVAFIGYNTQQLKVKGDVLNIALSSDQRSLSEVVVTGYGTKEVIEEAHPVNGWDSFRKYLENATSPDGKTGKVRIRFVVNADNTLSGFKVTKSLSPDADAEAIRLIKEGPAWVHNINGEPETVTVRIKFK